MHSHASAPVKRQLIVNLSQLLFVKRCRFGLKDQWKIVSKNEQVVKEVTMTDQSRMIIYDQLQGRETQLKDTLEDMVILAPLMFSRTTLPLQHPAVVRHGPSVARHYESRTSTSHNQNSPNQNWNSRLLSDYRSVYTYLMLHYHALWTFVFGYTAPSQLFKQTNVQKFGVDHGTVTPQEKLEQLLLGLGTIGPIKSYSSFFLGLFCTMMG